MESSRSKAATTAMPIKTGSNVRDIATGTPRRTGTTRRVASSTTTMAIAQPTPRKRMAAIAITG